MVRLDFLTVSPFLPPPPPPPPHPPPPIQCWISVLKVSPLKQHCMGGRGRAKFSQKSHFHHRTGGDNESYSKFSRCMYTLKICYSFHHGPLFDDGSDSFDQECRCTPLGMGSVLCFVSKMVCEKVWEWISGQPRPSWYRKPIFMSP